MQNNMHEIKYDPEYIQLLEVCYLIRSPLQGQHKIIEYWQKLQYGTIKHKHLNDNRSQDIKINKWIIAGALAQCSQHTHSTVLMGTQVWISPVKRKRFS